MKIKSRYITQTAFVASLYVIMTYISNIFGLANGVIQFRLSEALTVLPAFIHSAIPGLWIGCFISNLLTGAPLWDVFFGSLATFIGALGTYFFSKKSYTAVIPPILSNTLIIPLILKTVYNAEGSLIYFAVTVFLGEFISCGILGIVLFNSLKKTKIFK